MVLSISRRILERLCLMPNALYWKNRRNYERDSQRKNLV
jgi:hypothetical protein